MGNGEKNFPALRGDGGRHVKLGGDIYVSPVITQEGEGPSGSANQREASSPV